MTGVRAVPPAVFDQDEKSFTDQILEVAVWYGWRRHHDRPGRTVAGWRTAIQGDPGFPDLVLLRRDRLVVAELKSRRGKLTPEQLCWLEDWRQVGAEVYVWRPSDWDDIARILAR